MKRILTIFLLVVFSAVFAFAQGTTGRLSGTISGPDGALPGATITATDTKTGRVVTVTTNEDGAYNFPSLEFGTYTIRVTAAGFKTLIANEQKIDVGREATLSPILEIGNITAEVVVTAGADIVTSTTAQISNTVSPQQILSLPMITRNPLTLAAGEAGVSANTAQNTTINGMRTTFTNITRDGINIQDTFIRSNATDFAPGRPSVDDTGEFTITTSNQEADQGYGGAQIRLVTPRGTKDLHGALFAYNRNSAFGANNFFNNRNGTAKPFRNRNQFGGKVSWRLPVPGFGEGTPAWYFNKAFFFFAYEGIRDPVTATATRTVLSPAARAGTFTYNRATAGAAINTTINGANVNCPGAVGSVCTITNFLQYAQSVFPTGNIRSTTSPIIG
ncbi:MAG: carboxypeptidase-like regulatory domain-containing protein, partial [Acidobacteriota bacterium]